LVIPAHQPGREAYGWLTETKASWVSAMDGMGMLLHYARGLLELARGRHEEALAGFQAAERLAGTLSETGRAEATLAGIDEHERDGAQMRAALAAVGRALERTFDVAEPDRMREPLSQAETRVLRYLPTHLSAPEIADELYVSVNTVRTHMRHVYEKLGTHRRAEAVEQARALGLLASSPRQS
jgi:ATP/maltotriose-dependent transcriptional regulator MalT